MGRTAKQKNRLQPKYPEEVLKPKLYRQWHLTCDKEGCGKICGTLTLPEGQKLTEKFHTLCDEHDGR